MKLLKLISEIKLQVGPGGLVFTNKEAIDAIFVKYPTPGVEYESNIDNYLRKDNRVNLLNLGSYYCFIPGGDDGIIYLLPKRYFQELGVSIRPVNTVKLETEFAKEQIQKGKYKILK